MSEMLNELQSKRNSLMAYVHRDHIPVFDLSRYPQFNPVQSASFGMPSEPSPVQFVPSQALFSPAGFLLGGLTALGIVGWIWGAASADRKS